MVNFVNENNQVVEKVLEEEAQEIIGANKTSEEKKMFEPDVLKQPTMSKLKREVTILMNRQSAKEDEYNQRIQDQIE